ncbi:MAG: hypothetical protein J7K23_01220 [Thermoproteales archaeon]|nr:hypothetical protein [Thermoproteales archaeon]
MIKLYTAGMSHTKYNIKDALHRIKEILPYNKIISIFSDAYVADWVYGKYIS